MTNHYNISISAVLRIIHHPNNSWSEGSYDGFHPLMERDWWIVQLCLLKWPISAVFRLTYVWVLSKYEGWHEVSPHSRRLEDEEEGAEVLVYDILAFLVLSLRLNISTYGEVGAFCRPKWRTSQTQNGGGGDQARPVGKIETDKDLNMVHIRTILHLYNHIVWLPNTVK